MYRHFEQELENLRTNLIKMASIVEEDIRLSIKALVTHDISLAQKVIDSDYKVNELEIQNHNSIIDLLALQQPVAGDLRMILAAQKINNDLERLGDHAVNIAQSALSICTTQPHKPFLELPKMAEVAQNMLRKALDGFIHSDVTLCRSVLQQDDEIDNLNILMIQEVIQLMKSQHSFIEGGLDLIRVSRNLERVADLATNIAEEVIFITQARVVKHHAEEKNSILQ
ncbi:MAG: phosphate signaling complex protein PhoU [Ignavibacteriae bacterium]|nr:phosphate signaling complex protein PhoU [Ignavibacteriota bacterium]